MTWIEDPAFATNRPFGPQTLPYGVITAGEPDGVAGTGDTGEQAGPAHGEPGLAVRVGDHALPLRPIADSLGNRLAPIVAAGSLDPLLAAGRPMWRELRERLTELVTADSAPPRARLVPLDRVSTRLPFTVGDYVDFYSSRHHAENVARIFRPDEPTLPPSWTHLPVAYHGRAGTVVVSGTGVERPHGQRWSHDRRAPEFGPSQRLDIEAEVGFVCGGPTASRVSTSDFPEHVLGVGLVNDWSARDIQAWESQPLGPNLAKSFATSLATWITPLDALDGARIETPPPEHPLQDYLAQSEPAGLDLRLEVYCNGTLLARPPFADMSWSPAQQLAHMTVNGASARPGDLFASGTVSGPEREQRGCLLELTWGGQEPVRLEGGEQRAFLLDGDEVVISGTAPGQDGSVVGLAEVRGRVLPAGDGGNPAVAGGNAGTNPAPAGGPR